jgi:formylglycine-generating enzyme required for sulfatase activity
MGGGEIPVPDIGPDVDVSGASDVVVDGAADDAEFDGAGDSLDTGDVSLDAGGGLGTPCRADVECASGDCVDLGGDDIAGLCSDICGSDEDCPEGFDCVLVTSSGADAERRCLPTDYCADRDEDGFGVGPGCSGVDCNDDDPAVNIGADEVCDGVDNDCDELVDENSVGVGADCTTGFQGVCSNGRVQCIDGDELCSAFSAPTDEVCDGLDNDCDGSVDEDVLLEGYVLVDGVCEPVACGAVPEAPANARLVSVSSTQFGGEVVYACEDGYVLTAGELSLGCDATGAWAGSPALCTPVDCGVLSAPENGDVVVVAGTSLGATASYSCFEGYSLTGPSSVVCTETGSWSTVPTCSDTDECASGGVCTAPGNGCTNTPGGWECICTGDYAGPAVAGADATCTLPPTLGESCTEDAQCGPSAWCPTDTPLRYCSPRPVIAPGVAIPFQYIPSGTFMMGAPGGELGSSTLGEESRVVVTLSRNYFVARTEVTQGQWRSLTGGANPACFQSVSGSGCVAAFANDGGPVEQIDWYSALAFANAVSAADGLEACYSLVDCANPTTGWYDGVHSGCTDASFVGLSCSGYRLPTEAEWERAARAGTTTATWLGNLTSTRCSDATLLSMGWFCANSGSRTQSVTSLLPNPWGLYDMLGNVREWVWDAFVFSLSGGTDPLGAVVGPTRVRRGGHWGAFASATRSASRDHASPAEWNSFGGFRLARTAD